MNPYIQKAEEYQRKRKKTSHDFLITKDEIELFKLYGKNEVSFRQIRYALGDISYYATHRWLHRCGIILISLYREQKERERERSSTAYATKAGGIRERQTA